MVGVKLKHDPTWHITGSTVETQVSRRLFNGPDIEAGPIHWAPPQIVKMGQLEVYGYEGRCLLLILSRPMFHWFERPHDPPR